MQTLQVRWGSFAMIWPFEAASLWQPQCVFSPLLKSHLFCSIDWSLGSLDLKKFQGEREGSSCYCSETMTIFQDRLGLLICMYKPRISTNTTHNYSGCEIIFCTGKHLKRNNRIHLMHHLNHPGHFYKMTAEIC